MDAFELVSDFKPKGDQIRAIEDLSEGLDRGLLHQVLMGVTGSGKTFTVANVIARANRPVLVISHNKTWPWLFQEFRRFFPRNAVEYFVSYYDYYQPEAYLPSSNTYIAKEVTINDEIDRMRLNATNRLFERRDVIIVASVSCIYGIGAPETYYAMSFPLAAGERGPRKRIIQALVDIQYERQEDDFKRGGFRVRGDVIDVFPAYADFAYRIELDGDAVGRIHPIDPFSAANGRNFPRSSSTPGLFLHPRDILEASVDGIEEELKQRVDDLRTADGSSRAERLEERTLFDLDMLREFGYCPGIKSTPSISAGGSPASRPTPSSIISPGFPDDHRRVARHDPPNRGDVPRRPVPQGTLIEHGFRLPSALDNRPLQFREYEERVGPVLYVSATPAPYEIKASRKRIIEQIIRPTGLIDPEIEIRPVAGQVEDLRREIERRAARKERVLVTTLTKKMAEDLTPSLSRLGTPGPLPPRRDRNARARRSPPGSPERSLRRSHRHQPPARRPGPSRGLPRRRSRRRQGGIHSGRRRP